MLSITPDGVIPNYLVEKSVREKRNAPPHPDFHVIKIYLSLKQRIIIVLIRTMKTTVTPETRPAIISPSTVR